MGYVTDYSGDILLSEKGNKKMKKFWEELYEKYDLGYTSLEEKRILISECWKDYDDVMLKFAEAIAIIDNEAYGDIEANGEEKGDIWKISISNGNVLKQEGVITYEAVGKFSDLENKKWLCGLTKDKGLQKEVVLESLK